MNKADDAFASAAVVFLSRNFITAAATAKLKHTGV